MTKAAPGFEGKRVLKENGDKDDANDAVIKALQEAGNIIARGRLKHQYPHSWRSKKPVIFRNTPQWFIGMDKPLTTVSDPPGLTPGKNDAPGDGVRPGGSDTLRATALSEIKKTEWVPAAGENRITGMIAGRPDWVVSRQRAWGVPIAVFRNVETDEVLPGHGAHAAKSPELMERIEKALLKRAPTFGSKRARRSAFSKASCPTRNPKWEQVKDVLDVWFDSGCTHAFTLEDPETFPGLKGISAQAHVKGGQDRVMYLEGSDQHRGWFHSSLLESCGTRGHAPYDIVLTHGFVLDEKGDEKMSKSKGNVLSPQDVMKSSGADILRLVGGLVRYDKRHPLWAGNRAGGGGFLSQIAQHARWMLGALAHFDAKADTVSLKDMPRA